MKESFGQIVIAEIKRAICNERYSFATNIYSKIPIEELEIEVSTWNRNCSLTHSGLSQYYIS